MKRILIVAALAALALAGCSKEEPKPMPAKPPAAAPAPPAPPAEAPKAEGAPPAEAPKGGMEMEKK
jgi:PBP1b-binding outer membrane lipoprotein LpoB